MTGGEKRPENQADSQELPENCATLVSTEVKVDGTLVGWHGPKGD
jgi:hypothetical protein